MTGAIDLAFPFTGRWRVQNSPADRVPSHGTTRFASAFAIDFVPLGPGDRTAPFTWSALLRPEPPEAFPGFGRPILSPARGTIVAAHDGDLDHAALRGLPSIGYALTQRSRAAAGWRSLAGNHVLIETEGAIVALCHLQRGSIRAPIGRAVGAGDELARCGNSGNSTEPHLHVQAIDRLDVAHARAVPLRFDGMLPRNGAIVAC